MTTMRAALRRYFDENGFGDDGGYSAEWVDFKLGPIPFPLPNTEARKKAVRFHDLNHLLTGYRTDLAGEFEISAWELGAGCKSFHAAWVLNMGGLAAGALFFPKRTWRAFIAGRRSGGAAYALDYDEAMASELDAVKQRLGVRSEGEATITDAALYGLGALGGMMTGLMMMAVLLSPVTLVLWWRGRSHRAMPA